MVMIVMTRALLPSACGQVMLLLLRRQGVVVMMMVRATRHRRMLGMIMRIVVIALVVATVLGRWDVVDGVVVALALSAAMGGSAAIGSAS